jgi:uncharacterized protein YndB with AHSA1/START domain
VQQLGDHEVGDGVVDRGAEEHDPVGQQPGVDVEGALAPVGGLDDGRHEHWDSLCNLVVARDDTGPGGDVQPKSCDSVCGVDDDLTITRDIDLDLSEQELWDMIGDGDAWSKWLTDAADVVVAPGRDGEVVDDGERRFVHIDDVVPGRRVAYRWWPASEPDAVSSVELVIIPSSAGSTLRVRETIRASSAAAAAHRWEVRAIVLWSCAFELAPIW